MILLQPLCPLTSSFFCFLMPDPCDNMTSGPEGTQGQEEVGRKYISLASFALKQLLPGQGKGQNDKRRYEWVLVTSFSNSFLLFCSAHQVHTRPQHVYRECQPAAVSLAASRVSS